MEKIIKSLVLVLILLPCFLIAECVFSFRGPLEVWPVMVTLVLAVTSLHTSFYLIFVLSKNYPKATLDIFATGFYIFIVSGIGLVVNIVAFLYQSMGKHTPMIFLKEAYLPGLVCFIVFAVPILIGLIRNWSKKNII